MASKRVRMIDVAQEAGVSRTTASFVLNGRDSGIPAETRQRVLRAARQLRYRQNSAAYALATGRTRRVGIVLNDPGSFGSEDEYFSAVVNGMLRAAVRHDYNIVLHAARFPDRSALCSDITSGVTDGAVLVGRFTDDPLTQAL